MKSKFTKFTHKTPHLGKKQHQIDPNLDLKQLVHHATVQYVDRDADGDVDIYDNPKKRIPDENPIKNFDTVSKKLIAKQKGEIKHTRRGMAYEDLRNWFDKDHPEGNWRRFNTKGEPVGPCAREPGDPKPKCLSKEKAAKMTKKEIAAAVRRKREKDPVADRPGKGGKPKMISNKIKEEIGLVRYCPKCKKNETRSECAYGPKYWDMFSMPSSIMTNQSKYDIAQLHPTNEEKDHEHSMARSQLSTVMNAAKRLKKKMGKGEGNIEAWVQSKITKAADYLDAAADYLDSGEHDIEEGIESGPILPKEKGKRVFPKGQEPKATKAKLIKPSLTQKTNINAGYAPSEIEVEVLTEKNKPTNPKLWAKWKSKAKAKFDVYPCVPLESQAITKDGLKNYDELKIGEDILTYNIHTDLLEWKPILHLHFYEQAPLKRIYKKTGFSIRATENHKWVVRSGNDYQNISLVETKDINKRMRIITCSSLNDNNGSLLINEQWSKKDNWVQKVLSWNNEQREVYLASSIVYDGHDKGGSAKIKERHTFGFSQKDNDHFWATLLSAYLNGYHVSFYEKTDSISGATIIRNKKYHSTQNLIIEDDNTEDVWCPTTENNTWVMVQNGFITITGNSAYANGWAAKGYKSEGGGWKSVSEENEIEEAVRIPAKTGNLVQVMLTWRGKYYSLKMFFPQVSTPSRRDVQDQIEKVYPGSRLQTYHITEYKPGEAIVHTEDWQKVNKQDKTDGMSKAAVDAYRRENPDSKLQTAVTGDPEPGSRDAERRKSYCLRSKGQQDMHNIDCSKDPDKSICKARRRWKC